MIIQGLVGTREHRGNPITCPDLSCPLSPTAKIARLSLALPPLAMTIPPTGKGGFGDGTIGNRIGRRRGLSPGSDPDEEEDEEQEDDNSRRVIVVTETDVDKRVGLRSLLKSPKEPMDRERDRGRNVSFFDDVTIYLFDQVFSVKKYFDKRTFKTSQMLLETLCFCSVITGNPNQ